MAVTYAEGSGDANGTLRRQFMRESRTLEQRATHSIRSGLALNPPAISAEVLPAKARLA
jgi:hypothetical protein